jgi:cytochrome d ubiquinol oxidase subunit II
VSLPELWFVIIAVLWTGFFVLEGFDFGVGVLHGVVTRSESEKRVAINAIGPFWDANEVWLVVGGAAIFAAFPPWYATWLSAGYLAIVLLLAALIVRGVSFEFRAKVDSPTWRGTWSGTLAVGSLVAPVVLGVALGDLVVGLPVDGNQDYTGSFWDLFTGYGVWTAVTLLALCLLHGATFLALRTTGELRRRARRTAAALAPAAFVAAAVFAVWTLRIADRSAGLYVTLALALLGPLAAVLLLRTGAEAGCFAATAVGMAGTVAALFVALYPDVLVSSTSPRFTLTVAGSASGHYALQVMTVVAVVLLPVVLLYQGWSYVVFRRRLTEPPEGGQTSQGPNQPPWSATSSSAAAGPHEPGA